MYLNLGLNCFSQVPVLNRMDPSYDVTRMTDDYYMNQKPRPALKVICLPPSILIKMASSSSSLFS